MIAAEPLELPGAVAFSLLCILTSFGVGWVLRQYVSHYLELLGKLVFFLFFIMVLLAVGWASLNALADVLKSPGNYVWLWVPSIWSFVGAFRLTQLGIQKLSINFWKGYQLVLGGMSVVLVVSLALVLKRQAATLKTWFAFSFGTCAWSFYLVMLAQGKVCSQEPTAGVDLFAGWTMALKVRTFMLDTFQKVKADSPGRNEWLDERIEWGLCWIIWLVTALWLCLYGYFCDSEEMKQEKQEWNLCGNIEGCCVVNYTWYYIVSWSPVCLIVPGYIMFLGFVSQSPSVYDWAQYIMNFLCLVFFRFAGGLTAYLLGYFGACIFLLPVIVAGQADLAKYSYRSYTLGVGWTTGISNAICAIAYESGYISEPMRWKVQIIGWTTIMSGSVIVTAWAGETESYKLTLGETLRYSAFQLACYTFIYFGICRTMEAAFDDWGGWF